MSDLVRLELLKLSRDILSEQMMSERMKIENDWNAKWNVASEAPPFPEVPTVKGKDVVKLATLLEKFVYPENEKSDQA